MNKFLSPKKILLYIYIYMSNFNDEVCEYYYSTSVTENFGTENFNNICLKSCNLASKDAKHKDNFNLSTCKTRCDDPSDLRGSLDMINSCKLICDYTNSHLNNFSLVECQNICLKSSTGFNSGY
jgi:hypothetical protein